MSIYEHSLVLMTDNPNLGPARVVMREPPIGVELHLLFSGAKFPCRKETQLELYPLPAGTRVSLRDSALEGEIIRQLPAATGTHRRFAVLTSAGEEEVAESVITPLPPSSDEPLERLKALRWDSPSSFFARRALLQELRSWYEDTEGLPTLTGARVHSMAHQLYAVQRVLWARSPRFVLADEVGLGKTIEAGLVLQALLSTDPELSVLVIAPGSMTRQWLCELYLRFGARPFQVVSDLNQTLKRLVIVSTTTLSRHPEAWARLTERRWGMVVIDEAHQHPPGSALYKLYRQLSQNSEGILVLSATPSKREIRGILGLLALVAPDQYDPTDEERVRKLWAHRQEIWDRLGYHQQLREAPDFHQMPADMFAEIAEEWEPLLMGDETAPSLLKRLREGDRKAFDELEAYVQEHYRVDHRIIRTRRKTVQALGERWGERRLEVVEYDPSPEEALLVAHIESGVAAVEGKSPTHRALAAIYLRLLHSTPERCLKGLQLRQRALRTASSKSTSWWEELLSDPSPEEEERLYQRILEEVAPLPEEEGWLAHAIALATAWRQGASLGARHKAALRWIEAHLKAHPDQKLLVFTEDRNLAQAFAAALSKRIRRTVEAFHWVDTPEEEERLKRITLEFQRNPSCPVLVSDELGGEGRNFQMAEAVLHLDCPWAVARLEQRIGRLDRIGRGADRPVRSVVFLGHGGIERQIHRTHAEIFQVHQRSIGGLEFLLPDLQRRIFESAVVGAGAMETQHNALKREVDRALREAEQDFDQSLDTSRHELERAKELVEILKASDGVDRMEPVQYWARSLGLSANAHTGANGEPEFRFRWSLEGLRSPLSGDWGGALRQDIGTFDRYYALEREDLQFFAPGHRLIDAQLRALESSPVGGLTVFGRNLGSSHRGRPFALVLVHFDLDPSLWTDERFDVGLLTRARRRLPPEVIERSFQLSPEGPDLAQLVEEVTLKRSLEADFKRHPPPREVAPSNLAKVDIGRLARALERALELATQDAEIERKSYAEEAMEELMEDLGPEMGFLRGREDPESAEALRQRKLLLANLLRSRARVVGVALIFGM